MNLVFSIARTAIFSTTLTTALPVALTAAASSVARFDLPMSRGSASSRLSAKTDTVDAEFECPPAVSAPPGTSSLIEEQPVRYAIDKTCTVLVVGGTRGIGLEWVRQCGSKGASVIATYRGEELPTSLAELSLENKAVQSLRMDVEDEESVSSAAEELRERLGKAGSLTHVIVNAGIYLTGSSFDGTPRGGRAAAAPVTKDIMMRTFAVNSIGPLVVAQSFIPLMVVEGQKVTADTKLPVFSILTSKVGSVDDNASGGAYAYRASKSALNNIAKSLSVDLKGKVSVVLLHPGYVRTDMTSGNGLIDTDESVRGMMRAIETTNASVGFRLVDYKAALIPW